MTVKDRLDLTEAGISVSEIMTKVREAQKQNLDEVEFVKPDGTVVRMRFPHVTFDPYMERDT